MAGLSKNNMESVLVLDGRQRSSLAIVRSLGRRGINVTVGEDNIPCLASRSKYCAAKFEYISPLKYPLKFIESLLQELKRNKYAMIIPTTDLTCYLVAQYKEEIAKLTKVPIVEREQFMRASEKSEVIDLCKKIGIPFPKSYSPGCVEDIINSNIDFDYPVVIKPRRSKYLSDAGWVATGVGYANTKNELIAKLKNSDKSMPLPIIQERIQGPGLGAFALFNKGDAKAIFFHRRIREIPPSGGVSVLRESIAPDSIISDYSLKLLKALNWHGVAMVEFKLDAKNNIPKIMEINARFWGSLQLAIDSDMDFPYMLYKMTIDGDIKPQFDYKIGVQSRWLMGDVDHLLARLFKSRKKLHLPDGSFGRIRTIFEFCKFYKPNMKYEVLKLSDIRPFFHELIVWCKQIFRIK